MPNDITRKDTDPTANPDLPQELSLPNDAHAFLRETGKQMIRLERTEDAARIFALLNALAPGEVYYARCLGICLERLDRFDEAIVVLDRAIAAEPNEPFARTSRAAIRMLRSDREGALQDVSVAEANLDSPNSKLAKRVAVMKRSLTRGQAA